MGGRKLTKRIVDAAEKAEREFTVWDCEVAGFGLRVYPSGRKAYVLKYRVGGGRSGTIRKPVIGTHGALTVEQAREIEGLGRRGSAGKRSERRARPQPQGADDG